MKQSDVIAFFDRCASHWDAEMIRCDDVIAEILDHAHIRAGIDVLDVACGTGVLFPDYAARRVGSLTAIDIAPEMVKIARRKWPEATVLCGDVETAEFSRSFDAVVLYNAFPHFPEPARLVHRLAGLLKPGGCLTVAHGMSRERLAQHHANLGHISLELLPAEELAALFARDLTVDVVISNERMYQVCGHRATDCKRNGG